MKKNKNKESVINKKNKRLYWIIGIIIEVIIILVLIYIYFFNKPYDKIIECKKKNDSNNSYTMELKDIFYLKDGITIKEKQITNYAFQYETSYLSFLDKVKESATDLSIEGYSVKFKQNDDIYVEQIIYEYDIEKLKNDKNVKITDKTLTFETDKNTVFSLTQLTEQEIFSQYEELGYTCE